MIVLLVLALVAVVTVLCVTGWRLRRRRGQPDASRRRLMAVFVASELALLILVVCLIVV